MGLVNTNNLISGMVLAENLTAPNGRLLLPKGTQLNPDHIQSFHAWGIAEVPVLDDSPAARDDSPLLPLLMEESRVYLAPLFSTSVQRGGVMEVLFGLAAEQVARQISRGWKPKELELGAEAKHPDFVRGSLRAEELIERDFPLSSLPEVYAHIVEVLNSPCSSAAHLAEMVSKDSSLSSRLLKLVNSSFFSFSSRVDSISRAISLLGTNELTTMAVGISVVKTFENIHPQLINMEGFWRHSIACGVFAKLLGGGSIGVGLSGEQLFIGGLLHDIGKLALVKTIPGPYGQVLVHARQNLVSLIEAERSVLGFDHARVGGLLCQKWKFTKALEEMVWFHHEPARARYGLPHCIVHLANILAEGLLAGHDFGGARISSLDEKAWQSLGLSEEQLPGLFAQAHRQTEDIANIFLRDPKA